MAQEADKPLHCRNLVKVKITDALRRETVITEYAFGREVRRNQILQSGVKAETRVEEIRERVVRNGRTEIKRDGKLVCRLTSVINRIGMQVLTQKVRGSESRVAGNHHVEDALLCLGKLEKRQCLPLLTPVIDTRRSL
ncbi:MAG TPA: hypothetical protein VGW58_04210 [Pyrinomonadaceae bacterium]|nr:hypothetical protein [Pyrinomonadaceae bacterium]